MKTHVRGKVFLIAALAAATAIGCGSKDGGSGVPEGAKGALAMLPGDADVYMGVDFASLKSSALFKQYEPMIMSALGSKLADAKAQCGFDPLEQAGTVVIAMKGEKDAADVTAVITGFKKDQVMPCLTKMKPDDGSTVKVDGDYAEITKDDTVGGILAVGDVLLFRTNMHHKLTKDDLVGQSKLAADKSAAGSKSLSDLL